jgi:hypothetical protein
MPLFARGIAALLLVVTGLGTGLIYGLMAHSAVPG